MNVTYELEGQRFEWDSAKADSNLTKHGISFERACEVFFDPFFVIVDVGDEDEAREAAIGLTEEWNLLFVVHVVRGEDAIRIISARTATAAERKEYEDV
ncbi:MAG TPA: BrnT family toxin [Planctomycetota bacterium]|nr:BrnT family toxin [Planctomycetota bacterium]